MYIASAATTVKFHHLVSGDVDFNYQPGSKAEGVIKSISWSKDGNWLAIVPFSGVTEIISVKDKLKLMHTIQDVAEPSCAAFQNTTKKLMAVASRSGQVFIYDIKTRSIKKRYPRVDSLITHVEFTSKDSHIIAGCRSGDVFIYSNVNNSLSSNLKVPNSNSVSALRANPTKRHLLTGGSNEGIVTVWDLNVGKPIFMANQHQAPVSAVAFSPVNPDLVLSSGLDRQYCFYDIVENKTIASLQVDNNLISADFSSDGNSFIMGSQSGKILVYDSRSIKQPAAVFESHNMGIKHLAYQKNCESSFASYNFEGIPVCNQENPQNRNVDSFEAFMDVEPDKVDSKPLPSGDADDSFLQALGLNRELTAESIKSQSSVNISHDYIETRSIQTEVSRTSKRLDRIAELRVKTNASTPKLVGSLLNPLMTPTSANISPIPSNLRLVPAQGPSGQEIREIVKDEVRTILEEVKGELKYQGMVAVSQMRRHCLELQMCMIKEFIKLENRSAVKEDLGKENSGAFQGLLEENERLRQKIAFLEEQLASTGRENGEVEKDN